MTPEIHNRIHDELKDFLKREPTENEIMNGQSDVNIMIRVKDRLNTEEKGLMQDQIDQISTKVASVESKIVVK